MIKTFRLFGKFVRLRSRQFINSFQRTDGSEQLRYILLGVIFSAFMVSLTYLFNKLFLKFLTIPMLGRYVMLQTLSLIFLSFFLLLFFSSMVTVLSTLYMSDDLAYLFSSPTSSRSLFWTKSSEALFHACWMVVVFGYPVLVSYGYSTGARWFYYPTALLVLIPFILVPFSLGNLVVNAILYWIPIKRVRAVMVGVGICFGGIMIYVLRLLRPKILFEPEIARNVFVDFLGSFRIGTITGLPSYHAAYALHFLTQNKYESVFLHLGWLIGISLASLLVVGWITQDWYEYSWLRTREGRPQRNSALRLDMLGGVIDWLPRPYRGLTRKELYRFLRQTTQWSQLLVLVGIVVVHVANLVELPRSSVFLNQVVYFFNIALIGFVMTAVCVRFVFPTISFEGEAFWTIRSAPVSMFQYFLQKILFYVFPIGILGGLLITVTNSFLNVGWDQWGLSIILVFVISLTLTSGALAFGAMFPKFNFNHFGEVVTSTGSVLYMLCGMFYVAGVVGIAVAPVWFNASRGASGVKSYFEGFPLVILIITVASSLLGLWLLWIASRAVKSYEFSQL